MTSPDHGNHPEIALADYLDVLRRRRWVVLQTFAVVACVGAVATLLSTPVYRASAKLQVEASMSEISMLNVDNPLTALLAVARPPSIGTQMQVMQSRPFMRDVYDKVKVGDNPVSVRVSQVPDSRIIEVTCESSDPRIAAAVPNTMLEEHLKQIDLLGSQGVVQAREFVEQEAKQAQKTLAETETALIRFRQQHRLVATGSVETIAQEIAALETATRETGNRIALLQGQRKAMEETLAGLPEEQVSRTVQSNPRIDDLKARIAELEMTRATTLLEFKPAHPRVIALDAQLAELKKRLVAEPEEKPSITRVTNPERAALMAQLAQVRQELVGLQIQQERLTAQLGAKRAEYARNGVLAVRLAQLERTRAAAEKSYTLLTDKLQDLRIREKARRTTARIVEPASEPRTPVRPRKATNLMLAGLVGLSLGIAMAFLQEFLDDRVNSPDDVDRFVGLPVLGHIPTFVHSDQRLLTQLPGHSPITESYRGLRTSIAFSGLDHPVRTLLVSSAHEGEGKSHTAVNLAMAMALEGRRVILVDTDLRRPNVHRLLQLTQGPGMSEVLIGQKTLVEALRDTEVPGLRVVTSGALPPNPAELLNSTAMERLVKVLQDEADVVIFDTPPCIPVTDATVLSARVDGVLLVIRVGKARKAAVRLACDHFAQGRARILGVVLNGIDHASGGRYYYYYDYRRSYYHDDGRAERLRETAGRPEALAARLGDGSREGEA